MGPPQHRFAGFVKLQRGGLVVYPDPRKPNENRVIAFQYNPETVSRSVLQQSTESDWRSNAGDTQHATLPLETVSMTIELDAADQPTSPAPGTVEQFGLHPVLLALELLLYPSSGNLEQEWQQEARAEARVAPGVIPMVLLVWGRNRVLPVRLTSLSISEEAFDRVLNPIRARVELSLRSLTSRELRAAGRPWSRLVLQQVKQKESTARKFGDGAGILDLFKLPPEGA